MASASRRFGGLVSHLHQKKILSVYLETRKKFGRWFPCINVLVVVSEYVGRIFGFIGGHHQVVRSSQLSEVHSVAFSHFYNAIFKNNENFDILFQCEFLPKITPLTCSSDSFTNLEFWIYEFVHEIFVSILL